jgi:hypothetical protein
MSENLPDSVFPNNWFSTHAFPTLKHSLFIIYPMKHPSRQAEVNPKVVKKVGGRYGAVIKIEPKNKGEALEGTGCLIFDHTNFTIYANISERCSEATLDSFMKEFNSHLKEGATPFKLVKFRAFGSDGSPIYHTNVMMGLLANHAVVCLESIKDKKERSAV